MIFILLMIVLGCRLSSCRPKGYCFSIKTLQKLQGKHSIEFGEASMWSVEIVAGIGIGGRLHPSTLLFMAF